MNLLSHCQSTHVNFFGPQIVWFKNPLEYFQGPDSPVKNFDVIFQDDGGRTLRYGG